MAKVFQVDTAGTLMTSLVSYFRLEDLTDDIGSNGLTNVGTATFPAGKVNNGVLGDASSKYLKKDSPSGFPTGTTSRSMSFWLKRASGQGAAGSQHALGWGTASNGQAWEFYVYRYSEFGLDYYSNAAYKSSAGILVADTWHHFIVIYDHSVPEIKIYLNGSLQTLTGGGAPPSPSLNTGVAAGFRILSRATTGDIQSPDIVDEVGIWSKVLSSTEISDLYNGGAGQTLVEAAGKGKFFPFLTP